MCFVWDALKVSNTSTGRFIGAETAFTRALQLWPFLGLSQQRCTWECKCLTESHQALASSLALVCVMSGCSRVHIVLLIFQCLHLQQVGVMCPVFYTLLQHLPHLNHMECFLLSVSYTWERTTVEFKLSKVHVWKRLENLEARVVSSSFLALRKAASSHSLKYISKLFVSVQW